MKFAGFSQLPGILYKVRRVLGSSVFDRLTPLIMPGIAKVKIPFGCYEAIVVLHENWDTVYTGNVLIEHFNAPSMVLLQLPPFYGSKERFLNIIKALLLWRELRSKSPIEEVLLKAEILTQEFPIEYMNKRRFRERY